MTAKTDHEIARDKYLLAQERFAQALDAEDTPKATLVTLAREWLATATTVEEAWIVDDCIPLDILPVCEVYSRAASVISTIEDGFLAIEIDSKDLYASNMVALNKVLGLCKTKSDIAKVFSILDRTLHGGGNIGLHWEDFLTMTFQRARELPDTESENKDFKSSE